MHLLKTIQGGALLTALFIMTLVAIVATAMSTKLQLDIYRTRLIVTHDKLYLASEVVTFWALETLNDKSLKFSHVNKQGMVAEYPKNLKTLYEQVHVSGGLYDLQARFNLNNLVDKKSMATFTNLIGYVYPHLNDKQRSNLTLSIKNWIDTYDLSLGKDNYTSYYLAQKPPYYPSHELMKSNSELRLIKDVDARLYMSLEKYITVLPETTPININTASKQVLRSIGNGINAAQVNELVMARGEEGIKNFKDISELLKKLDLPKDQITLESKYFLSVAHVTNADANVTVYTVLKRSQDKNGKISVGILRESLNGF